MTAPREPELLPCPKVKLKFMVDPDYLKCNTFIDDPVRCVVTDPEAVFLMGILGDSGRDMVKAGFPFYFERPLAEKLINAGFAKQEDRLLAPSAPGLDREKLTEAIEEFNQYYELRMKKGEWSDCGCVNDLSLCDWHYFFRDFKKGRFDVAASRGADKWERLLNAAKAVLPRLLYGTDMELNKIVHELCQSVVSLEAGAPEGEK